MDIVCYYRTLSSSRSSLSHVIGTIMSHKNLYLMSEPKLVH